MNKYRVTVNRSGEILKASHVFKDDEYEDISEDKDLIIVASSADEARAYVENMIECIKYFRIPMYVGNIYHFVHRVISVKKI